MGQSFLEMVTNGLSDFDLETNQLEQLASYASSLEHWSKKTDLIAPCSREELIERHLIDSLMALDLILINLKPEFDLWLDVGSGAGLPGLVWAIAHPGAKIQLLEPREKRALFLSEMRRKLGLDNLEVVCSRFEMFHVEQQVGLISCRALGSRYEFLKTSHQTLSPGGVVVELLGSSVDEQKLALESESAGFSDFSLLPYSSSRLSSKSDGRCLAVSRG